MNNERRQNASYENSNSRQSLKIQELEKRILEDEKLFANYLPLSGGTLTGDLTISKQSESILKLIDKDTSRGRSDVLNGDNNVQLRSLNDSTFKNWRRLIVYNSASGVSLANAFKATERVDGVDKYYNLYGDHNRAIHIHDTKLRMNDGKNQREVIKCLDDGDDYNYGSELIISGSGNVYIGAGESADNLYKVNGASSTEQMYVCSDGSIFWYSNCNTIANRKGIAMNSAGNFYPVTNGGFTLGTSTYKWGQIYSTSSSISTSDRNHKHDISDLSVDKASALIYGLNPVCYKFDDGTSNRFHWGLIAQDVEELMDNIQLESTDFAGFIKSPKEKIVDERTGEFVLDLDEEGNIQYEYALRYEEFIAPLIKVVQAQQKKINDLENRIEKLERLLGGGTDGMADT